VQTSKVGAIPTSADALSDFDRARAKQLGMSEAEYSSFKHGKVA
jgi:phage I-like protein